MLDRIVIVGAGQTTDSLVPRLSRLAPVTVLDPVPEALERIREEAPAEPEEGHKEEDGARPTLHTEIGRASCRERV